MRRVTRRATTPATTAATIVLGAALAGVLTWACGSGDPSPLALVPDGGAPDASEPPPSADGGDADAGDPEAALFPAACARGAFCPVSGLFGATVDARVWLNDVAGTSASDVWAVGSRGTILHYDGKAWRVSLLPTNETLAHVLPRADGSVWATSSLARIHVRPANGGAWHAVAPTDDWGSVFVEACGVTDMWGSPDSEWVWFGVARAYGGTVPRLTRARGGVDGISVEAYGSGVGEAFGQTVHALAGHGSGELWGVGDLGSSFRITAASSETPGLEAFNTQPQGFAVYRPPALESSGPSASAVTSAADARPNAAGTSSPASAYRRRCTRSGRAPRRTCGPSATKRPSCTSTGRPGPGCPWPPSAIGVPRSSRSGAPTPSTCGWSERECSSSSRRRLEVRNESQRVSSWRRARPEPRRRARRLRRR